LPVENWIHQHIAHLDRVPTTPLPVWADVHAAHKAIKDACGWLYNLLTGHSPDFHLTIAVDWEESLMVPWMPMSTRVAHLRRMREQKKLAPT
jgi:hypothetical protein